MFHRDPKTAQMGREILPFEMGYLPEFFQRKAEVELNDTPENREKGLKILWSMKEKDETFNNLTADDEFLLQYLRCRKYNIQKAFSQIKASAIFRRKNKDIFMDFHFENFAVALRKKLGLFLPYRCQDGCAIGLIQLANWDPEEFPFEQVKKMVILAVLQSLRDPMTQVNGFKFILDVQSTNIRHIKYATPSNMYLLYYGFMVCAPGRFKQFHIVNNSLAFKIAWTFMKPFLNTKIKSRIFFHDSPESLLDFFPASVLPTQYGGELTDYDMTDWLRDVMTPEKLDTLGGAPYHGQ